MMTDRTDPPRFDEEGPEALRALIHVVRDRGPTGAAAERISKRLAMAGVPVAPAKGALTGHRLGNLKLTFVALAAAGALAVGWQAVGRQATLAPSFPSEEAARSVGPTPPPASEPTATRAPVETSVVSIADLPSAAAPPPSSVRARASAAGSIKGKTSAAVAASADPSTELEIMQRAEAALASDPGRALAITNDHARAYPSGELVQERELIAVEALSRIGRKEAALERAHALVRRFPRTPYAARLELATGKPFASLGTPRNQ